MMTFIVFGIIVFGFAGIAYTAIKIAIDWLISLFSFFKCVWCARINSKIKKNREAQLSWYLPKLPR